MDLTEAEDTKKWQEHTEELHKKDLNDPDNHDGVITHLEPDILEYEVKWALGSITTNKASGGDRIPAKLFQVLKDNAMKVLNSICHSNSSKCWKTQQWPQDWKRSVFIPKERPCQRMFKLLNKCTHFTCQHSNVKNSPSQASTVCEPRTSNVQAGLEKAEEAEIKSPRSVGL